MQEQSLKINSIIFLLWLFKIFNTNQYIYSFSFSHFLIRNSLITINRYTDVFMPTLRICLFYYCHKFSFFSNKQPKISHYQSGLNHCFNEKECQRGGEKIDAVIIWIIVLMRIIVGCCRWYMAFTCAEINEEYSLISADDSVIDQNFDTSDRNHHRVIEDLLIDKGVNWLEQRALNGWEMNFLECIAYSIILLISFEHLLVRR